MFVGWIDELIWFVGWGLQWLVVFFLGGVDSLFGMVDHMGSAC